MPELAIRDLDALHASWSTFAAMIQPRDRARQIAFFVYFMDSTVREGFETAHPDDIDPSAIARIQEAYRRPWDISADLAMDGVLAEHYWRPEIAGYLLGYVLACAEARDIAEPPTLQHACETMITAGGTRASLPGTRKVLCESMLA